MKSDENQKNRKFQYPSVDTLHRLFVAADAFRMLTPWQWMGDREVVAVHDTQSERVAYCVVMGEKGLCFGLEAMLGDRGLSAYCKTVSSKVKETGIDFLNRKDSLTLFFENKDWLTPEDLIVCKEAGVEYSAPRAWPQFRRFEPGFLPWLMQESDAAFMAVCLEQVVNVAHRAKADPGIFGPRGHQTFLARIPNKANGVIVWRDELISPVPMERVILITPKVDHTLLGQTFGAAKKTGMVWEADCFWQNMSVGKPDERPRYPFCYMMADNASDFILHVNLVDENDHGAGFLGQMCEVVKKQGVFPETILIRQPHLAPVFAPLAAYGIATKVVNKLSAIDRACKAMLKDLKPGGIMNSGKGSSSEQTIKAKNLKDSDKKQAVRSGKGRVYQFKVTVDDIRPAIWRKFQVESDITLKRLAATILIVMGWTNSHLHQFGIGKKRYGIPQEEFMEYDDFLDEGKFRLSDFSEKEIAKVNFAYDFGDGWTHTVRLEKVLGKHKDVSYPVCIGGARKCPRENCGGPAEYENFLRIISDPKDPEYPATIYDVGKDFDPEMFDADSVNRQLKHVAQEEKCFDQQGE